MVFFIKTAVFRQNTTSCGLLLLQSTSPLRARARIHYIIIYKHKKPTHEKGGRFIFDRLFLFLSYSMLIINFCPVWNCNVILSPRPDTIASNSSLQIILSSSASCSFEIFILFSFVFIFSFCRQYYYTTLYLGKSTKMPK